MQKDLDPSLVRSMTYRTHERYSSGNRNGIQRQTVKQQGETLRRLENQESESSEDLAITI